MVRPMERRVWAHWRRYPQFTQNFFPPSVFPFSFRMRVVYTKFLCIIISPPHHFYLLSHVGGGGLQKKEERLKRYSLIEYYKRKRKRVSSAMVAINGIKKIRKQIQKKKKTAELLKLSPPHKQCTLTNEYSRTRSYTIPNNDWPGTKRRYKNLRRWSYFLLYAFILRRFKEFTDKSYQIKKNFN